MKEVMLKISSFFMALLVLFSTMSFSVDKHYCGDTLVDSSIFFEAEDCGMEMQTSNDLNDCSVIKKNCCLDTQLVVNGQNELQIQTDTISFDQQVFIFSFVCTYIDLFEGLDNNVISYEAYKPPRVVKQLFKIDETYLI